MGVRIVSSDLKRQYEHLLGGMTNNQIFHIADIQNSSRMSPTSYFGKYWLAYYDISWGHSWSIASNSTWMLAIEIQNLCKTIWLGLKELYKFSIWSKDQSISAEQHFFPITSSHLKVSPVINWNNHIIKWNVWANVPYFTGTTSILVHISTLVFRS